MKPLMAGIVVLISIILTTTYVFSAKLDLGLGIGLSGRRVEITYQNYAVSDGVGGWSKYQTSDGGGGWEYYQVME